MRLIRIMGLGLSAAFAVGAMGVAAAQAAPEYGRCLKTAKVDGKYSGTYVDPSCRTRATEKQEEQGKKNEYKWEAGPGPDAEFTAKLGRMYLESAVEQEGRVIPGAVTCGGGTGTGKITGISTGEATLTLTGCESRALNSRCYTSGQEGSDIEMGPLKAEVVELPERGVGAVGIKFTSIAGPEGVQGEFGCWPTYFVVRGSLTGTVLEANRSTRNLKADFSDGIGQGLEDGLYDCCDGAHEPSRYEPIQESGKITFHTGEKMEIKTG